MQALRREILPPSGVEYAVSLRFLPSTVVRHQSSLNEVSSLPKTVTNLVVAYSNLLRIFEVHEEDVPIQSLSGRDNISRMRRDTEAVEGEVEMDSQGEGFVNMGTVKSSKSTVNPNTTLRLYFIREHRLHGTVTGLESIRILTSVEDDLDRLLVSFKDAKVALLEWSPAMHDIITVSIHTYERAPQMMTFYPANARTRLRADPNSRCAALSLTQDAVAILPFYQSQAELDLMDVDQTLVREIPYSQSFVLDLAQSVDSKIRNIVDFIFLPGFNNPTIAVLCQPQQTWTGRLKEFKDTCWLIIFTLDLITHKYPIITSVENLPYDSFSITACSPSLGGVIISSSNALIYVDQSSRKTALPTNGWTSRVTDLPLQALRPDEMDRDLHLEGSSLAFMDEHTFFLILKDGTVYPVDLLMDGKIFSRLSMGPPLARTTIPSTACKIHGGNALFIGSTAGSSVVLRAVKVDEAIKIEKQEDSPTAVVDPPQTIAFDDDDDIYGDAIMNPQPIPSHVPNGHSTSVEMKTVIHLSICDSLPAYGPISDISFALTRNGDRPVAELVAATGFGHLGGFTLFQKDLPTRTKRKLHAVGGARGVWSLSVRQSLRTNGSERAHKLAQTQAETDSVIISTDANPSPGLTRFGSRSSKNEIVITNRRTETTIGAATFFQRTAILHVTTDCIRVLEPDGNERQCIKDMENIVKRPKIRYCSISDPFVLILREDDSLGLFVGDAERGKIRRKDMTPMGEKVSKYSAGCFYLDQTSIFETSVNPSNMLAQSDSGGQKTATSLEAAVDAQRGSQWLFLCRPQGVIEIWTLPKLSLVFSSSLITSFPPIVYDSFDPPALSIPEDPPRKPSETDIEQIQVASMGESSCQPYLMVLLRCGQFAVYQAVSTKPEWPEARTSRLTLALRFAKVASRYFEPRQIDFTEKSILLEQRKTLRLLIPFTSSPTLEETMSGVFFTGDQPCWIIATAKAGVQIHSCTYGVVNSFTTCSMWDSKGDFLLYTDEGPCLLEWMPDVYLGTLMPSRSVPLQRNYSNITFDASTGLLVAASCLSSKFTLFDEEGNKVWEPDAENVDYPSAECSTLELYSSDFTTALDGYEFAANEFVNAVECVTLETQSTESGTKDYIAVATTINRGEDLAVKGATYIFEVIEVVADSEKVLARNFRLRMLCRDEAKGPVTALCGMDGYLVSSMGQKIFVRAFDLDERLVGVAFLDVGVYVTAMRALKNLLIIGDAMKSVWFVAFQEDPFKLVVLSKDVQKLCVATADYLFTADGQFSIVVIDEEGIIRLLEYEPTDPESRNGQYLLRRTEFHGQVECRTTALIARRDKGDDGLIPQARLVCGASDGSIHSITPVEDSVMKRLQLLQGQLARNIQHIAGLNPKAFRIVKNERESKPLSKGILDGNLLAAFPDLPISQQNEITRQIATERSIVLKDWSALGGPW